MTVLVSILLLMVLLLGLGLVQVAWQLRRALEEGITEVRALRVMLSARQTAARIRTDADQDGVEEAQKVARATRRARVSGGDPDSEQHQRMTRQTNLGKKVGDEDAG